MEEKLKVVAISGFVGIAIYWVYRVLDWVWFRPKKLEKCLRDQGFKGNPYRLLVGDQKESEKLIKEALSKPIGIDDDIKKRIMPHILKTVETHGKNSFMWVGRIPRVHITDPELIREILTKYYMFRKNFQHFDPITKLLLVGVGAIEGDVWVKHRKLLNPAFHFEKLKFMLPRFYTCCCNLVSKWEGMIPDGGSGEVEVWHDVKSLVGEITSETLFSGHHREGKRVFDLMVEFTTLTTDAINSVYFPGKRFLPTKRNNRMRAIDREIRVIVTEIINKKMKAMKAGESTGEDLLGILLESHMNEIKQKGNNVQRAGLNIQEIIDECKHFYFAGQDTNTALIVWTMFFLSRYPQWQTRAREEILQVFGDKQPGYDGISRLKVVTMILNEVLRIYVPIVELTKVAHEDTQLGKYFIPAGVQLMMPAMLIHHDPEMWGEDVMEFKPERFAEGGMKATKVPGAYFPFGLGPRMCIGQNLALLEVKMAMSLILRRFSFELSPSYVHAPITIISLLPQYGAHLMIRKL